MRKISATWLFPGEGPPLKHGILTLEDDGSVKGLTDTHGLLREEAGLEHYSGILTPGFVNVYCEEISAINQIRNLSNTFCVLSPASDTPSNRILPSGVIGKGSNICLGTESGLSDSNHSILKVMLILQAQLPDTPLQELIDWACINGAKALGINHRAGSFSIGKKPGVNLITGSDLKKLKLTASSKVKVLL